MFAQLLQMTGPSPESCPLWQSKQCAVLAQSFPRILVLGFMFFMCLYKCVHLCAWWLKHTHDCCASGVLVWVISVSTQPRQSMAVLLYMTLITDNYISGTFARHTCHCLTSGQQLFQIKSVQMKTGLTIWLESISKQNMWLQLFYRLGIYVVI